MPPTSEQTDPAIRVRRDMWDALRKRSGLTSDASLADALGVSLTTVYHVMAGREPSARFIACTGFAFPFASFDRLFELYRRTS